MLVMTPNDLKLERAKRLKEVAQEDKTERLNQAEIAAVAESVDRFTGLIDDRVDSLERIMSKEVIIEDIDALIDDIQVLKDFAPAMLELKAALQKIPTIPDSIQLTGQDNLIKAISVIEKFSGLPESLQELEKRLVPIAKALNDDIYARYDWANSSIADGNQYIGYLNKDGAWFIQRISSNLSGDKTSVFATGRDNYKTNWLRRQQLDYRRRDQVTIA